MFPGVHQNADAGAVAFLDFRAMVEAIAIALRVSKDDPNVLLTGSEVADGFKVTVNLLRNLGVSKENLEYYVREFAADIIIRVAQEPDGVDKINRVFDETIKGTGTGTGTG